MADPRAGVPEEALRAEERLGAPKCPAHAESCGCLVVVMTAKVHEIADGHWSTRQYASRGYMVDWSCGVRAYHNADGHLTSWFQGP